MSQEPSVVYNAEGGSTVKITFAKNNCLELEIFNNYKVCVACLTFSKDETNRILTQFGMNVDELVSNGYNEGLDKGYKLGYNEGFSEGYQGVERE